MKRRNREINIFNLSMLDVISGAMAAFLMVMVILFPYYKKDNIDYDAKIKQLLETIKNLNKDKEKCIDDINAIKTQLDDVNNKINKAKIAGNLDIVIVLDTTGSMGQVIGDIKKNIIGLAKILRKFSGSLNIGFVAYKDHSDKSKYSHLEFPITPMDDNGTEKLNKFIGALEADGGDGDLREAVDEALEVAVHMNWKASGESTQSIILIGDAASYINNVEKTYRLAESFHKKGELCQVSAIFIGEKDATH